MLTEFSIGNFQAFNTPQRVPLKPITLVFGPNSTGKSTLLRSLLVARHAILNGRLSKSEGAGERHPGSFEDIRRNGGANAISFGFTVCSDDKPKEEALEMRLAWKETPLGTLETSELSLQRNHSDLVTYASRTDAISLQTTSLGDDLGKIMISAGLSPEGENGWNLNVVDTIKNRLCLPKNLAIPGSDADHFRVQEVRAPTFGLLPTPFDFRAVHDLVGTHGRDDKNIKAAINSIHETIADSIALVDADLRSDLSRLVYHGPIRPICNEITRERKSEPGMAEWWNLATDRRLLGEVNDWLAGSFFTTKYCLEFCRMFPESSLDGLYHDLNRLRNFEGRLEEDYSTQLCVGSFYESEIASVEAQLSQELKEQYDNEEEREAEVARRAEKLIFGEARQRALGRYKKLRASSTIDDVEAFLNKVMDGILENLSGRLDSVLGYESAVDDTGFHSAKIHFCSHASPRNPISPSNMGIGFSQMMPLVASAFGSENNLIAIEQPELHIHPALQTELADLFIQSAKERGNRFLIETHSEHLILRVMKRIRQTFEDKLPEGKPRITPDEVCVLYVEPGENGSVVREMPLNERGELVKGWPGGFFEEALNEMF